MQDRKERADWVFGKLKGCRPAFEATFSAKIPSPALPLQFLGNKKITKDGSGTMVLSADNTIKDVVVREGALRIGHSSALGSTSLGTTVSNLAALEIQGGIAVGAEALTLNGSGIASGGLTSGQLAEIRFADPNGYYSQVGILANGEIVPVPEPATLAGALFLIGLIAYRERRFVARLWRRPSLAIPRS